MILIPPFMANIEHMKDYNAKSGDVLFFDTNVWMLIFSSQMAGSRQDAQEKYSTLLKDILSVGGSIFINSLILSEYINASLRIEFDRWKRKDENIANSDYKKYFRQSKEYSNTLRVVCNELQDILSITLKKNDDFNTFSLDQIYVGNSLDFNDAYYIWYCHNNNIIFVSDDHDISSTPIEVRVLTY